MADKSAAAQRQADVVTDSILDYIASHNLKPGDRLPSEREMAELFHAGRPAIREAVRALCAANILEVRRQSGTFVSSFSSVSRLDQYKANMQAASFDVLQLYDLRMILETECIALAAKNITDKQLEYIGHLLKSVSVSDERGFAEVDRSMHHVICEATQNRPLQLIMETVTCWSAARRSYTNSFQEVRMIVHNDLRDIYSALCQHNEQRCRDSMRHHIEHLRAIDDISINAVRQQYSTLLSNSTWETIED